MQLLLLMGLLPSNLLLLILLLLLYCLCRYLVVTNPHIKRVYNAY